MVVVIQNLILTRMGILLLARIAAQALHHLVILKITDVLGLMVTIVKTGRSSTVTSGVINSNTSRVVLVQPVIMLVVIIVRMALTLKVTKGVGSFAHVRQLLCFISQFTINWHCMPTLYIFGDKCMIKSIACNVAEFS